MSVLEIEATRKDIFRMLLDVNNEKVLTDIKCYLNGMEVLHPDIPFSYSPDALRRMVDLSENAIRMGQVMTGEQLKAKHPIQCN
jgi:hypothetical protein